MSFVRKAVGFAKQRAFGLNSSIDELSQWAKLVTDYDLDTLISKDNINPEAFTKQEILDLAIQWAIKSLIFSNEMIPALVDHDDQVYAPVLLDLDMFQSDWVIADEAQDCSLARRLLVLKILKPGGRSLWIADNFQCIYFFAGADIDAVDQIIAAVKPTVLKLTTTFRCPQVVVELAKKIVPDFEAAPSNIQGTYEKITSVEFFKTVIHQLPKTKTLILCRNTAPLVKTALRLISMGLPCYVEGKDIGKDLINLVSKWKTNNLGEFKEKLENYLETRLTKLLLMHKERQAESLEDRVLTIFAVIQGLPQNSTVFDLKNKLDVMFQKTPPGVRPNQFCLMTIHRCKGMQEDNVVIYGLKNYSPSRYARTAEQKQQEQNLIYVALTRTMKKLIEVEEVEEVLVEDSQPATS